MWLFYFLLPVKRSPPHRNFRRVKWNHFYKLPVPGAWVKKCQQFFPPAKTSFFLYFYVHRAALTAEALPPALMFSSLILFEPVAVDKSIFILGHVDGQFSRPQWLKKLPFPSLSRQLVKKNLTICTKAYFWALCSIPSVHMSVCMPAPQLW